METQRPLRVGIGGPAGSGKTALLSALCKRLGDELSIGVVTNDRATGQDAEFLIASGTLPEERVIGVELGDFPRSTAGRSASMTLNAVGELSMRFPGLDLVLVEFGNQNPGAAFSRELSDLTLYVVDASLGQDLRREEGAALSRADLLVVNQADMAPMMGASMADLSRDVGAARGDRPYVLTDFRTGTGLDAVAEHIREAGMIPLSA
ncbi:GTP-binding protein [Thiohalorhabdus sp. Cl-TMA]|uniref:GTP-binding protein n=1 Tax=Thiohalorhabdus methylotrophus TaxID=3242694 RepID=A0ABV4TQE3_9GAMM